MFNRTSPALALHKTRRGRYTIRDERGRALVWGFRSTDSAVRWAAACRPFDDLWEAR